MRTPEPDPTILLVGPAEGGVARVAGGAAESLSKRGWNVRHVRVPNGAHPVREARRIFRDERAQVRERTVVHVEHGSNDVAAFWFALMVGGVRRDLVTVAHDAPRVVHAPGSSLIRGGSRWRDIAAHRLLAPVSDGVLRRAYGRRAAVTLVLSERARANWTAGRPREVLVLPHAGNAPQEMRAPSTGAHVLFAGYIGQSKGLDVLLEAWSRVGRTTSLPLVVAGEAPGERGAAYLDAIRDRSSSRGSAVQWLGRLDDTRFARAIADAAIVVIPYRRSNPASGIVIAAMSAGRAIVGTDVPAMSDFLQAGREGVIVPVDDVDALGTALEQLLADGALRDRLGAAAAARAARSHTWDAHCCALEHAYHLATGAKPMRVLA